MHACQPYTSVKRLRHSRNLMSFYTAQLALIIGLELSVCYRKDRVPISEVLKRRLYKTAGCRRRDENAAGRSHRLTKMATKHAMAYIPDEGRRKKVDQRRPAGWSETETP